MRRQLVLALLLLLAPAAPAAERNADRATFHVEFGRPAGTATCVYSDGRDSYLVTCAHVTAGQKAGTLKSLDRTKIYPFVTVCSDRDADVSLLHAKADLDYAPLAAEDPKVGDYVWHRGGGTGGGVGRRLPVPPTETSRQGCAKFAGDYRSYHGDSGSGLLTADGCVGAVLCGIFYTGRLPDGRPVSRASPASEVWAAVKRHRPDLVAVLTVPQPPAAAPVVIETVTPASGRPYTKAVRKPQKDE